MSERSRSKLSLHGVVQSPATPAPLSDEWRHCQTSKQIHEHTNEKRLADEQ